MNNESSPPESFFEGLPLRTNEELFDALAHREDYLPSAIRAINEEISRRGIKVQGKVRAEEILECAGVEKLQKSRETLTNSVRILTIIFCPLLVATFLWFSYLRNGFKRKSREIWVFYLIGVCWRSVVLAIFLFYAKSHPVAPN